MASRLIDLSIKNKKKQKKFARAARFAVHSFAVVLYCR